MTKRLERSQAREMRAAGRSIRSIARELRVSQGSVSVWVRGATNVAATPLPPTAQPMPAGRRSLVWRSDATRRCARCRGLLPVEMFGKTRKGRQSWCKPCFRAHARSRGRDHHEQVKSSKLRRREIARAWVLEYLANHPCVDCGMSDPVVLDFDHIGPKSHDVGTMIASGRRLAAIEAEAARCEVVCASCHRRRTAARAGWLRASPTWRFELGARADRPARNKLFVYEALVSAGCVDCSCVDLVVLDFDHIADKHANIATLAHVGYSLVTIAAEIAKCEVRCANCHRRRTASAGGHYRALADAVAAMSGLLRR